MRLVDADELIKEFDPDGENLNPITVRLKIARQPTAYNVDKVAEQLESEAERWRQSGKEYQDQNELGVAAGYQYAIKIVKAGGGNE